MRRVWRTLRPRHLGMGAFWACSMLTFRSTVMFHGAVDTPSLSALIVVTSFVANMTTLLLAASLIEHNPAVADRVRLPVFCALIVAGLGLLAVAGHLGETAPMLALVIAGALLAGVGYGVFWGSWAETFGRVHPSRTSFYIPMNFLLTATLFLGVSLLVELADVPALPLIAWMPVASAACLARCRRLDTGGQPTALAQVDGATRPGGGIKGEAPRRTASPEGYTGAFRSLAPLLLTSIVLSFLFGFVWEITVVAVGSVNEAHLLPLVANLAVALGIVAFVVLARWRIDLDAAYRLLVPVMVVAFIVMPLLWSRSPVVLNALISAGYGLFDVVIWFLVTSCAFDLGVSGFVTGGVVRAVSILTRLVGIGVGYVITLVPDESMTMALVCVGVGAVTGGAPPIVLAGEVAVPSGDVPVPASVDERCRRVAACYGLTRREAEVLPYLARGRSARVVAEALFVSEATVRTHIRRILEKTTLHSKQEIIDLIEAHEECEAPQ